MPESFIFRNYYLNMLRKEKGVYVEIPSTSNLNNTFDELISYEEVGPIEGVFNYGFSLVPVSLLSAGFKYNDTIKFEIYIMDRALNKSNTILSDSIIILKK